MTRDDLIEMVRLLPVAIVFGVGFWAVLAFLFAVVPS